MSDRASAVLLMSSEKASNLVKTTCTDCCRTAVGSDDINAHRADRGNSEVLWKAGLTIRDIDMYEVNEAFACPTAVKETVQT